MNISRLLDPISQDDFLKNIWGKEPLHISGYVGKFECLPGIAELPRILAGEIDENAWRGTQNLTSQAYKQNADGSIDKFLDVPIGMYTQLFNSGYGLCFNDVSFAISALRELLEEFSCGSDVSTQDIVTCYLTPKASRGILHFDNQHVFFIQRNGCKKWRISIEPGIQSPFENLIYPSTDARYFESLSRKGYKIRLPSECKYKDLILTEGDVLYLPPGHYHLGNTTDDLSFHYTVTLASVSYHSKIYSMIYERSRKFSKLINRDLRFANRREAELALEASHKAFREIMDDELLTEMRDCLRTSTDE